MSESDHAITFDPDTVFTYRRKNTWRDWHIVPASRPLFNPPAPKYQFTDIPGADGGIDFTNVLGKRVPYNYREGSNEFIVMNGYGGWQNRYSEIMNYLQGKNLQILLDDDPGYYYVGRSSVNEWRSEKDWSRIVIDYHLKPYKYERTSSLQNWLWDALNFEIGVIREYKDITFSDEKLLIIPGTTLPVVPTFIVKTGAVEVPDNEETEYTSTNFNWQTLRTSDHPTGLQPGLYDPSTGEYEYNTDYVCTAKLYKFDDYARFTITPTSDIKVWVTEYDNTKGSASCYGQNGYVGGSLTVEVVKGHYYGFTFTNGFNKSGNTAVYVPTLANSTSIIRRHSANEKYKVGDIVYVDKGATISGDLYMCVKNITIQKQFEGNGITSITTLSEFPYDWLRICGGSTSDLSGTTFFGRIKLQLQKAGKNSDSADPIVSRPVSTETAIVIEMLALRCWRGMYGFADERKLNIEKLGYDYEAVQAKINELSVYFSPYSSLAYDETAFNERLYQAGIDPDRVGWASCDVPVNGTVSNPQSNIPQSTDGDSSTIIYNWRSSSSTVYPSGFIPGWYDPSTGGVRVAIDACTIASGEYITLSSKYKTMTLIPPDGYYTWTCKYDRNKKFIKSYCEFPLFNSSKTYNTNDFVLYDANGHGPLLYRFNKTHTGAWNQSDVDVVDGKTIKAPRRYMSISLKDADSRLYTFTLGYFYNAAFNVLPWSPDAIDKFRLELERPDATVWKSGLNVTYQNNTYYLPIGSTRNTNIVIGEDAVNAPWYDSSKTYSVGDYVTYSHVLYRCIEACSKEAFDKSKWTEATNLEAVLKFTGSGCVSVDYRGGIL